MTMTSRRREATAERQRFVRDVIETDVRLVRRRTVAGDYFSVASDGMTGKGRQG
jgi:hypothetical protein